MYACEKRLKEFILLVLTLCAFCFDHSLACVSLMVSYSENLT